MKQITVRELKELLDKVQDTTKLVQVEGCDCWGDAVDVTEYDTYILIERNP